ncbi:hypothetical protein A2627_05560 [Candidatus Woesebacteria bacterium RIFCSPHIGHO2_01_FULL_39_28]|uniref:Uncharacterized protein n=1 Tax=Candidatus Woesebacteria bacterium RIFCSPHIGHO2_01_FULL_39_28 TaxID=1802496 RepID=A0A1F7YHS5_9BACT|nr:MAG: hypothetical protein A2627_05560 [Candidatus Woesebacteria bacterium RIFCSPHIGHO2_01_FULL_39_28]OGM56646.1 MAG: hypothetical protein A3A50_04755 [Candidatus Woesebacteria bacterium RIFCSPLOWO2_01_FULL_38_20]
MQKLTQTFSTMKNSYISPVIIGKLANKRGNFNYEKLLILLGELNINFSKRHVYASAMLIRAVLDHVPPLLGLGTFEEVVNNYSWSQTDGRFMKSLLDFKDEANDILHTPISEKGNYLSMDNIPSSNRLNRLLEECLLKGDNFTPIAISSKPVKTQQPNLSVQLSETSIRWANFAVGRYVWSSFRLSLTIDNYKNSRPDYLKTMLIAHDTDGKWTANHFIFETGKAEHQYQKDEEFRIEPYEVKTVPVFISQTEPATNTVRTPMPDFDRDTLKLVISTKSGAEFIIPIKPGWVANG